MRLQRLYCNWTWPWSKSTFYCGRSYYGIFTCNQQGPPMKFRVVPILCDCGVNRFTSSHSSRFLSFGFQASVWTHVRCCPCGDHKRPYQGAVPLHPRTTRVHSTRINQERNEVRRMAPVSFVLVHQYQHFSPAWLSLVSLVDTIFVIVINYRRCHYLLSSSTFSTIVVDSMVAIAAAVSILIMIS